MLRNVARAFQNGQPIVSLSTDPATRATDSQADSIADIARARIAHFRETLHSDLASQGYTPEDEEEYRILREIEERKGLLESEQARLRVLFRRFDNLYYPERVTTGGADHWPEGGKPGRVHVSLNTPPVYVNVPASLQAVTPVENYVADSSDDEDRDQAARAERLYFEWKETTGFELMSHKACIVKALYGTTYGKVAWDPIEKHPIVHLIDSPENLYVGWGNSDFTRMDWAIYCYGMSPQAISETYGLVVSDIAKGDEIYPVVSPSTHDDPIRTVSSDSPVGELRGARPQTSYENMHIEVYDYWYKKKGKGKRPEIWNAIYVGNALVKNARHREYDELPYYPLPNDYIPGSPYGRPELYDVEQLIREKDERVTNAGQMIASITEGQRYQLVGPDAPDEVPEQAIPQPNRIAAPGAGAEIKAIQPFVPQYAVEDYLKRIDMELEAVSGLNELLLGRAPATILGSSKAIAALVANYEARIRMKRDLFYEWRKKVWRACAKVWEAKSPEVKSIIDGRYRLSVLAPELTPKDELEIANMAMSLVQNRLWSMERAMDRTGVEDPADEKKMIRFEQTDAALNPNAVQAQMTLAASAQALGVPFPGAQGQPTQNQQENGARTANPPVPGSPSNNQPENAARPPAQSVPANARAGNGAPQVSAQSMLQNGEVSGRILTNTPIEGAS